MNDASYIQQTGVSQLWGEKEYTPTERIGRRPTLDVNGLYSGFIGEGTENCHSCIRDGENFYPSCCGPGPR